MLIMIIQDLYENHVAPSEIEVKFSLFPSSQCFTRILLHNISKHQVPLAKMYVFRFGVIHAITTLRLSHDWQQKNSYKIMLGCVNNI